MRLWPLSSKRLAAPSPAPAPPAEAITEQRNRHLDRYGIIPALAESDRLGMEWHPYIMRRSVPRHRSTTINTDDFGFRCSTRGGRLIGLDDVPGHDGPVGLISGNSTAFGVGASSDAHVVSSLLNAAGGDLLWFNVAHRAANLTQERINLDLYAPDRTRYLVFLSGANNLIVTLLEEGGERFCTPFVGEPRFMTMNERRSEPAAQSLEERFHQMMESTARDFDLLGQKLRANQLRCLFLLQPMAAWCDRAFCSEERELIAIWDEHPSRLHDVHSGESLAPWRSRYVHALRQCCDRNNIDFIDLNTEHRFLQGSWVFADRIHLADEGHSIVAEIVDGWVRGVAPGIARMRE